MKKIHSLLILVVAAVVVIAAGSLWIANRIPASPFDGAAGEAMPAPGLIQRGEYVARLGDCVACHSLPNAPPFSGGLAMATPMGAIYATNITPDRKTGIGEYSLADFDRAVRSGVARDGHRLYPAMPYPSYSKFSDDDIRALYAFFQHGVPAVEQKDRASQIPWPLNMRWPLAFWSLVFTDPGSYQPKAGEDALWNRGAYLVQGPGHCGSCHTPRGLAFNEKALTDSSPLYLSGAPLDGWYAPSLRGDANRGLGHWSEADIVQFLKSGRNQHAVVFGSMTDAFNNSTQYMSDDDLRAIAHYLKSLPGNPKDDGTPMTYQPLPASTLAIGNLPSNPGAQVFMAKCSFCHGRDGRGQSEWIPPLAGAASLVGQDDNSAINVTLNGSGRIVAAGIPDAYRMPPLREQLSDQQIAEVLTFVRSSWGNQGPAVNAKEVAAMREKTNPASISVIILEMR